MTALLSEVSDFDHFLNIVISYMWVNYKYQNGILKLFYCRFVLFLKVWGWIKILLKIENFHDRGP